MTASLRPTAARLALLRAVADGRVWHYPPNGSGQLWAANLIDQHGQLGLLPPMQMIVLELEHLITHAPADTNDRVRWELTAAGRQILDQQKET